MPDVLPARLRSDPDISETILEKEFFHSMNRKVFCGILAFILISLSLFCACSNQKQEEPVYDSVEALSAKLGYNVIYPRTLPGGCHAESYALLDGNIAQITCAYQDGGHLYYRLAQGADLKLGAGFGSDAWTDTITAGAITIYVSGAGKNEVSAAQWTVADFSYAILSDQPLSLYYLLEIIASIA